MFSRKISGLYAKVQKSQILSLKERVECYENKGIRSIDYVALYEDLVRAHKLTIECDCSIDIDLEEYKRLTQTYTLDSEFLSKALHELKEAVEVLYVCTSKSANGGNGS